MVLIDASLKNFTQALTQGKAVACTSKGHWCCEGLFIRIIKRILGLEDRRIAAVAAIFNNKLDYLEKIPVAFNANSNGLTSQSVNFQDYVAAAKALQNAMKNCKSSKAQLQLQNLKIRTVALLYRLEGVNGGREKEAAPQAVKQQLMSWAMEWKSKQDPIFTDSRLTYAELAKMEETSQCLGFIELLQEDMDLRNRFFKWTLKNYNDPQIFIQFPFLQKKIKDSLLSPRIGYYGGTPLQIQYKVDGTTKRKVVTLPFNGKAVNILDDQNKVRFFNGQEMTIEKVFKVFSDKRYGFGVLEFFADGINWWEGDKVSKYVNLDLPNWWDNLPKVKVLSCKETSQHYGIACNGLDWIASLMSTRSKRQFVMTGHHSYLQIAIPDKEGNYRIYDFGKYAKKFPTNILNRSQIVGSAIPGVIAYPDENIFYLHRQHAGLSVPMSPEKGLEMMDSIKEDLQNGAKGNLGFQLFIENCGRWSWKKMNQYLGMKPIYEMSFMDLEPGEPMGTIFTVVKKAPSIIMRGYFSGLAVLLGGWKSYTIEENGKKRKISLLDNPPWAEGATVVNPSRLFRVKENLISM